MSPKRKILIIVGIILILILAEGIYFLKTKKERKLHMLTGIVVPVLSNKHVPDNTKIIYNSNPPTSGKHYAEPQDAGIYVTPPQDGHLVHSLEHGAVILWYNPRQLSPEQIKQLKTIFISFTPTKQKIIMTPREILDVPVAVSSWGRMLKLQTIDEEKIKNFFKTNYDQGPEQAPI
ncbi:MAG TPA: DUF3105 domain-containing protein [Candidatus Saccharimonadales bacterium]|nr:DUF3105 domain-containing protein [Candidatus Saccharimonadales bacterium]